MVVFSGAKVGVIAGVGVVTTVLAACGSTNNDDSVPGSSAPDARHVDSLSGPAVASAGMAATGLGSFYMGGDSAECSWPGGGVDGTVSDRVWDAYSCRTVMTPQAVKKHCRYGAGMAGGGTRRAARTVVSRHPLSIRFAKTTWGAELVCPGQPSRAARGAYQVTVTEVAKNEWIVTGFKTLTGPGAGNGVP